MDPKYHGIGSPVTKLIEECGEMIHALCKLERFGPNNTHPHETSKTNWEVVQSEFNDIVICFSDLMKDVKEGKIL